MVALVINAPKHTNKRSFESTLVSGVGEGYAIWSTLIGRCQPGCRVVLLSKDERKRAEGSLVKLVPTEKTGSGVQRYDVHIERMSLVPYKAEALNRYGVAVVEVDPGAA
jgi:hypothetical protein